MTELLQHQITVANVLGFLLGWATLRALVWLRRTVVVQHSTDGGALSRRLRAEEAQRAAGDRP